MRFAIRWIAVLEPHPHSVNRCLMQVGSRHLAGASSWPDALLNLERVDAKMAARCTARDRDTISHCHWFAEHAPTTPTIGKAALMAGILGSSSDTAPSRHVTVRFSIVDPGLCPG